ncbi:MAG TPA: type 4a pilus biogenesis protein PilO [Verrucomicrobiae bacterium]|nr:type 4a pilus biogenesis protein PilO [Verrucomicrobiae bacterium]
MASLQNQSGSSNKNVLLGGIVLLLLGVGGSYQFLSPQLKVVRASLAANQANLKGLESDVAALSTARLQLNQVKERMEIERKVDFSKVNDVYPRTEDMPGLYLQLESLITQANTLGVKDAAYQVGTPVMDSTENAVRIPVSITGTGTYANLLAFVTKLEQNLRPLSLETFNLAQAVDKEKNQATGQFTLNAAAIVRAETLSASFSPVTK